MDTLSRLVDSKLAVEKETTRCKIRLTHLKMQNRTCEDTAKVMEKLLEVEHWIDERIEALIKAHPAYPWFSKVKGVGAENIAKCIGPIRIKPEQGYRKNKKTKKLELALLAFATCISDVWAYTGYAVDGDGKAMKPKPGQPLTYNKELRTMWWRLGSSILKAGIRQKCMKCGELVGQTGIEDHLSRKHRGHKDNILFTTVGTSEFARFYLQEKAKAIEQLTSRGGRVVSANELPRDGAGKKYEPEGIMSEGHIHNRALRKMIKLFQACLVLVWREAEGLPPTKPYAIEKLGHNSMINPWHLIDYDE
jgi:hypothetical protein